MWIGGGVGTEGMKVSLATGRHHETNIKRPKIAFGVVSIALSLGHLVHDCWGFLRNKESLYPPQGW